MKTVLTRTVILVVLVACCSCAGKQSREEVQKFVDFDEMKMCKVALLPFLNNSKFDQGNIVVQRIFAVEMGRILNMDVAREGDVRKIYREMRIYPNQLPNIEQLKILGSRLEVDGLISGRVVQMRENFGTRSVNPELTLNLQIHDAATGRLLLSTYYTKEGRDYRTVMHFGLINTVTELSQIVSGEILEMWRSQGIKGCEE